MSDFIDFTIANNSRTKIFKVKNYFENSNHLLKAIASKINTTPRACTEDLIESDILWVKMKHEKNWKKLIDLDNGKVFSDEMQETSFKEFSILKVKLTPTGEKKLRKRSANYETASIKHTYGPRNKCIDPQYLTEEEMRLIKDRFDSLLQQYDKLYDKLYEKLYGELYDKLYDKLYDNVEKLQDGQLQKRVKKDEQLLQESEAITHSQHVSISDAQQISSGYENFLQNDQQVNLSPPQMEPFFFLEDRLDMY